MKTPSFWCKTTRECWLWISASQACLMGADTPAGPSMTSGKTRWSALWRFEVCRCSFHFPQQCSFKAKAWPEVRASLSLAGFNKAHHDKSPSPQPLLPELLFRRKQNSFSCAKYKSPYCICQRKFQSHRWLLTGWSAGPSCWFKFLFFSTVLQEKGEEAKKWAALRNSRGYSWTGIVMDYV